ncbi:MAG: hypothetical protein J6Y72_06670 [Bacteroidales bacterium]|nr:hypothetical protein [Bacteroidales bacterium]
MKLISPIPTENLTQRPVSIGTFIKCFDDFFLECVGCDVTLTSRTDCPNVLSEVIIKIDRPMTNFDSAVISAELKVSDKEFLSLFLSAIQNSNIKVKDLPDGVAINF